MSYALARDDVVNDDLFFKRNKHRLTDSKDKEHKDQKETTSSLQPFIVSEVPKYLSNYPEISDAVMSVKDLVNEWKPPTPTCQYELEARLGRLGPHNFETGVMPAFMERVVSLMNTYQQWSDVTPWVETHDYFYHAGSDPSKPMVRTTAQFEIEPGTAKKRMKISNVRKYTLMKYDYQFVSQTMTLPTDMHQYDLRVTLNREETLNKDDLPRIVNPTYMRIKSRKTYFYTSPDMPSNKPIWRFDLTKSWAATTKTQAEMKQKNEEPTFELELECLDPSALMTSPTRDSFYVACSLLLKVKDFITYVTQGNDMFKWIPAIPKQSSEPANVRCF